MSVMSAPTSQSPLRPIGAERPGEVGNAPASIEEIHHAAKPQLNHEVHEGHEGVEANRLSFSFPVRDRLRLCCVSDFVSFVHFVVQKPLAPKTGAFPTSPGLSAPMGRRGDMAVFT